MDVINLNKNKIVLIDTDSQNNANCDDGCYWVEVSNHAGEKVSAVATLENGIYYLAGCENPESYQKLITKKLSYKLINPTESIRDEFERVWIASGEGAEKLTRDNFGCYDDELAFTAYDWFKIGAGKIEF